MNRKQREAKRKNARQHQVKVKELMKEREIPFNSFGFQEELLTRRL